MLKKRGQVFSVGFSHRKNVFLKKFSVLKKEKVFSVVFSHQAGSDKQPSPKGQVVPYPAHEGFDR